MWLADDDIYPISCKPPSSISNPLPINFHTTNGASIPESSAFRDPTQAFTDFIDSTEGFIATGDDMDLDPSEHDPVITTLKNSGLLSPTTKWQPQLTTLKEETQDDTLFGGPPKQQDNTKSPTAAFTDEPQKVETEWDPATPPSVGSTVILSDLNVERYQKWTKQRQVYFKMY